MVKTSVYKRAVVVALCIMALGLVYIFQRFNFFAFCQQYFSEQPGTQHPFITFIFNKTLRLCLNDVACFGIIWALFLSKKHLRLAFYVFLVELLIVLPFYFVLKLSLEGDSEISSPLLSQLHRLIVNPSLMILLMISFAYQRYKDHFYTS